MFKVFQLENEKDTNLGFQRMAHDDDTDCLIMISDLHIGYKKYVDRRWSYEEWLKDLGKNYACLGTLDLCTVSEKINAYVSGISGYTEFSLLLDSRDSVITLVTGMLKTYKELNLEKDDSETYSTLSSCLEKLKELVMGYRRES